MMNGQYVDVVSSVQVVAEWHDVFETFDRIHFVYFDEDITLNEKQKKKKDKPTLKINT